MGTALWGTALAVAAVFFWYYGLVRQRGQSFGKRAKTFVYAVLVSVWAAYSLAVSSNATPNFADAGKRYIGGLLIMLGFPAMAIALWYNVFFGVRPGRYGRAGTALIAFVWSFITIHLLLRAFGINDGIYL